jgi:hypothetical protein
MSLTQRNINKVKQKCSKTWSEIIDLGYGVIEYAQDGFPSDGCKVMLFSDEIQDMYFDNFSNEDILSIIKEELITRERYELLNEIKKNEENS